jgi:transcriptional regulator with XRE-family HTH domain
MALKDGRKSNEVGKAIKKARQEKKCSFEQIANQTGFSVDYLKNVEKGKIIPPVGTLLQLSKALGIDSMSLLCEPNSKMQQRIKEHAKRTENYAYKTLTPGTANKHLKAFHVSIEAHQEYKGVGYQHDGEEFVFVLSGKIELSVGNNKNTISQGKSMHFNSVIPHNIRNLSDKISELIVVIYTP